MQSESVVKKAQKAQKAARKKAQEAADTLIATVNGVKRQPERR